MILRSTFAVFPLRRWRRIVSKRVAISQVDLWILELRSRVRVTRTCFGPLIAFDRSASYGYFRFVEVPRWSETENYASGTSLPRSECCATRENQLLILIQQMSLPSDICNPIRCRHLLDVQMVSYYILHDIVGLQGFLHSLTIYDGPSVKEKIN